VPFVVRNPYTKQRGHKNNGLVSFVDITPSLLDFAGGFDRKNSSTTLFTTKQGRGRAAKDVPYTFQGRSFLPILESTTPVGWDSIFASHTFHEIQMYYPMRVVRDREYKLIWNIAYPLPYPFASDLWRAPSWQAQFRLGPSAPYGTKTVGEYIQRPEFEFFHIAEDPNESTNLADDPKFADLLAKYQTRLKEYQKTTKDPWIMKWDYE
jgi:N-sulfoglucosamine sulfohydrolase